MTSEPGAVAVAVRPSGRHPLAWGIVGLVAQAAFLAGWLIAEAWQGPGYNPVTDTISDMQAATAPHAWFPIICFAVGGLGTFGFAVFGLRPALAAAGNRAAYAPWMLAVAALAVGNSFPLIPCQLAKPGCTANVQLLSPGGLTDAVVASLAFLVLAITPGPLSQRMRGLPRWQRLAPVMTAARAACLACFILLGIASATGVAEGLMERILATCCVAWISGLAVTLIAVSRHPAPASERHPILGEG